MEISKDGDYWIVYSPMFDYMACGTTQEQALEHFDKGLYYTIQERVKMGLTALPN